MPSGPLNRPLSRLFHPATPQVPSLPERIEALAGDSPEQLAAIAMDDGEAELRAAAIERLPDGNALRELAGLGGSPPSEELAHFARRRLATLIDTQAIEWQALASSSENRAALVEVAELCAGPEPLKQWVASIADPIEITRLVVEGSSIRLRQLAAERVDNRDELNQLLKRLQGKDKSVYRILKDKRDALRAEAHKASQVEQDIRTIYTSLEALLSRPYDALFAPALEHFVARWQGLEKQAQPWARERVAAAIDRCRAELAAHLLETQRQAQRLAEKSAREAALEASRAAAIAHAAREDRERDEAAARAAAAAEEARQAEEKSRIEAETAKSHALRQIAALMARAHGALRAGQTGPAAGLRRAIEEQRSACPALPAALARGLQELDAKLAALKEWKDYAVAPKRAELIADMEALAGSEESPKKLAERIKELRSRWKTISQGVLVDSEEDWQRFNKAALIAYEPCRIYFVAQARLRAENVDRRRHVLERLQAFESRQNGEHPDWRAIGTVLYEAPQEWRRIGPVDRRANRDVEVEFEATLARLRGRLEAWQAQNLAAKRTLIEQARNLLGKSEGRQAVEGVKTLQYRWGQIGPAPRELEASVWNEFREQCDQIFQKRQQAFAEHTASLESNKAQAVTLCEQLEQLANAPGPVAPEATSNISQWRAAFGALGELPRSEARPLYARFERALEACEARMRAQRAHEAAQVFENFIEAARRIHASAWAVAHGSERPVCDRLKSQAEELIAATALWPKGGAAALKDCWARAERADCGIQRPTKRHCECCAYVLRWRTDIPRPPKTRPCGGIISCSAWCRGWDNATSRRTSIGTISPWNG